MRMEEEFSPKRRIEMEMENILDSGVRGNKVSFGQSSPVDIPS
jgi:hypothetical protein